MSMHENDIPISLHTVVIHPIHSRVLAHSNYCQLVNIRKCNVSFFFTETVGRIGLVSHALYRAIGERKTF